MQPDNESGKNTAAKDYYGTKRITAWPEQKMTKADEATGDFTDGYAVCYGDGYISWSPKTAFEAAYQPLNALSFGHAIEALKDGHKVARAGWNGKGMWLSLSGGLGGHSIPHDKFWSANNAEFARSQPNQTAHVLPSITMKTADDKILMGWLASQTDMLADDWQILE